MYALRSNVNPSIGVMGPLFINQTERRRSVKKSPSLEGEVDVGNTASNTAITTANSNSPKVDKDSIPRKEGRTTGTINNNNNVSVTILPGCSNIIGNATTTTGTGHRSGHKIRSKSTGESTPTTTSSSTEDFSNNEDFPLNSNSSKGTINTSRIGIIGTKTTGNNNNPKNRISDSVNKGMKNPGQLPPANDDSLSQQTHQNPSLYYCQEGSHHQQQQYQYPNHPQTQKYNPQIAIGTTPLTFTSSNTAAKDSNGFNGNGGRGCEPAHHVPTAHTGTLANGYLNGIGSNVNANGIRKYLVLLQDCLAIKFVSASQPQQSATADQIHFAFNDTNNYGNGNLINGSGSNRNFHGKSGTATGLDSTSLPEVDHSLHGLYLYKGFREANLKCYWNATLCDAIRSLDYKGYIVPSTILVFALPRFLTVLRTAWSRKMLRNPPGYRVEFVGEIEEIVAEPISQGQFAPLSDSLCWAILELTSSGQEAFVDSILFALSTAFPTMTLPPRELVYQTLEKLIRERKIYQTSHGYFVVTPDTFRYMNSGGDGYFSAFSSNTLPLDALMSSFYESDRISVSQRSWGSGGSTNADDLLMSPRRSYGGSLKRHNSLKVIRQRDLDILAPTMGARSLSFRLSKTKSVFESDREDNKSSSNRSSTLGSATDGLSSGIKDMGLLSSDDGNRTDGNAKSNSMRKKTSFFRRLFSFRRSKPKVQNLESSKLPLESLTRSPKIYSSLSKPQQGRSRSTTSVGNNAATQTAASRSYEDILDLGVGKEHITDIDLGYNSASSPNKKISAWNSLPSTRSRSRRSILNESPFYDTLIYNDDNLKTRNGVDPSSKLSTKSIASSSLGYGSHKPPIDGDNYSTKSIGVQSQIPIKSRTVDKYSTSERRSSRNLSGSNTGLTTIPRTDSPCPSGNISAIYATIANGNARNLNPLIGQTSNCNYNQALPPQPYNSGSYRNLYTNDSVTRRRHPSQGSQSYRRYASRPKSAFELLAFQNQHNRKKSLDSLCTFTKNPQVSKNTPTSDANHNHNSVTTTSSPSRPMVSTTTVTQNLTSTTSTELEVLLPIGKLVNAAISRNLQGNTKYARAESDSITEKNQTKSDTNEVMSLNLESSGSASVKMTSKPTTTETQVTTTTVNNNGTVETHFCSSSSTLNSTNGGIKSFSDTLTNVGEENIMQG